MGAQGIFATCCRYYRKGAQGFAVGGRRNGIGILDLSNPRELFLNRLPDRPEYDFRRLRDWNADVTADYLAKIVVESTNGPTTPAADEMMGSNRVYFVPDSFARPGGVTSSCFEWAHGLQFSFWDEREVNARMQKIILIVFVRYCKHLRKRT